MSDKEVKFIPSGRGKAQCPPDPAYPHGIRLTPPGSGPSCYVELPYPAPECGMFLVVCKTCDATALITAAGRPDDPTGVDMHCRMKPRGNA